MIDSAIQRPGKRKKMGPMRPAPGAFGGETEQALRSLEAYANQAEEALVVALDEVTLKDRRIAALEAELMVQKGAASIRPTSSPSGAVDRPAVVLPTLSPPLQRPAQRTRQAIEAIGRHTGEANQALAHLLAAAEEKEQGYEELQAQLNEARSDLEQHKQGFEELQAQLSETQNSLEKEGQRLAAASQDAMRSKDLQIAQLTEKEHHLQDSLAAVERDLATRDARLKALETEVAQLRETAEIQEHQLEQLREVLEHYVLRCRDLEHRNPQPTNNSITIGNSLASANNHSQRTHLSDGSVAVLSPLAQRLKADMEGQGKQASESSPSPELT